MFRLRRATESGEEKGHTSRRIARAKISLATGFAKFDPHFIKSESDEATANFLDEEFGSEFNLTKFRLGQPV